MTARERVNAVLNFQKPDRLPKIEWAPWWDKTLDRWHGEGLARHDSDYERQTREFALEPLYTVTVWPWLPHAPAHGAGVLANEAEYEALRPQIFSDERIQAARDDALRHKERHDRGDISLRIWCDGFFWFPRRALGIEPHLYAFYDQPELIRRMCADLLEFNLRGVEAVLEILQPEFVGFAEDMSYNNGPMLSGDCFREFLLPNYVAMSGLCHGRGVKMLVDTDGDVTQMIPWLLEGGVDGIYPLERQAGVDINKIRKQYPNLLMMGGFDKMVLNKGEAAIRAEFERILPVMQSGGYIPSVDHQTPPGVSLEQYRGYIKLFDEYREKG